MNDDFSRMRREYRHVQLDEADADGDPVVQFRRWFGEAEAEAIEMPNTMVLATVDADGYPNARCVLMKGFDASGFTFFSHSLSAKGRELAANPRAALLFYWQPMHRQVRITGPVSELDAGAADAYFATRPRGSQVAVWVADQSSVVPSREYMEERFREIDARHADTGVPRPAAWIGYRVVPETMEFWQGRENRLHDRLLYVRGRDGDWTRQRLAP